MIRKEEIARWIKETLLDCDYITRVSQNGNMVYVRVNDGRDWDFVVTIADKEFLQEIRAEETGVEPA